MSRQILADAGRKVVDLPSDRRRMLPTGEPLSSGDAVGAVTPSELHPSAMLVTPVGLGHVTARTAIISTRLTRMSPKHGRFGEGTPVPMGKLLCQARN